MGIEVGTQVLIDIFNNTYFFGSEWIIQLVIIFISMAIITRHTEQWKTLAFPVAMGWLIAGLHVNLTVVIVTGIVFLIDTMSTKALSEALTSVRNVVNRVEHHGKMVKLETTKKGKEKLADVRAVKKFVKDRAFERKLHGIKNLEAVRKLMEKEKIVLPSKDYKSLIKDATPKKKKVMKVTSIDEIENKIAKKANEKHLERIQKETKEMNILANRSRVESKIDRIREKRLKEWEERKKKYKK